MARRRSWSIAMSLLLLSGCQWVIGIEDKRLAGPCRIDAVSGPRARGAHLVPGSPNIAFCLRSVASNGSLRLPPASEGCPTSLAYGEVSAPGPVRPGRYSVRVVHADEDCTTTSSLVATDVTLGDGGTTLAYVGGGGRAPAILALPEATPVNDGFLARFANTSPAEETLDFGTVDYGSPPATLTAVLFPAVPFGDFGRGAPGSDIGYVLFSTALGFKWRLGAARAGATDAPFARLVNQARTHETFTLYAIGGTDEAPEEALLCNETEIAAGLTRCTRGEPAPMSIETFSPDVIGIEVPYAAERLQKLETELTSFGSDVICLNEVWPEDTKEALSTELVEQGVYTNTLYAAYDVATPFSDSTDLNGEVPSPRTMPYCATPGDVAVMNSTLDCIRDDCAKPPTETGIIRDPSCALKCVDDLVSSAPLCAVCVTYLLAEGKVGIPRAACTDAAAAAPFPFGGASGLLLLSRLEIQREPDEDARFVAPSTLYRRDVLHALVRADNDAPLDVYCASSPPVPEFLQGNYGGVYGSGASGVEAWRNERRLYFEKLFDWIERTRRAPNAVLLGGFGTAPAGPGLVAIEPNDYALFGEHSFDLAAPPGFSVACSACPDENPLAVSRDRAFLDFVLANGPAIVTGAERTRLTAIVPVATPGSDGGSSFVPLSDRYGFRSHLTIRP